MLNPIKFFVEYWAKRKLKKEEKTLIDFVLVRGYNQDVAALTSFIIARGKFTERRKGESKKYSISGRISYEMSPYGPVVKIEHGPPLNIKYEDYGLSKGQARRLYDAIIGVNGGGPRI